MASEKRLTTFPGRQLHVKPLVPNLTKSPKSSKLPQKQQIPPRLPLNVNATSNIKYANTITPRKESPWTKFHGFLEVDQAGPGIVAYQKCSTFPTVIIKKIKGEDAKVPERIKNVSNANIVSLREIFSYRTSHYIVYDCMSVSLTDIQATPCGDFAEFEIVAICKEVSYDSTRESSYI